MSNHLIIFIKNPLEGKVKTRIAATAGDKSALEIYLQLLKITKTIALPLDCHKHLFYSDFIDKRDDWPNELFSKHIQKGTDLGQRMKNAFADVFSVDGASEKKVLIIGSDCAELSSSSIKNSFQALNDTDFVIGPTFDGGYYLIGMKKYRPEVFYNIKWSTETVFSST